MELLALAKARTLIHHPTLNEHSDIPDDEGYDATE